jgi:hypothetical protein
MAKKYLIYWRSEHIHRVMFSEAEYGINAGEENKKNL